MTDEYDDIPENHVSFAGPCTCPTDQDGEPLHSRDEHGWGSCDVKDCECEAGWEE